MFSYDISVVDFDSYREEYCYKILDPYYDWLDIVARDWVEEEAEDDEDFQKFNSNVDWGELWDKLYRKDLMKLMYDDTVKLILCLNDGEICGGVYLNRLEPGEGEVKRLYVVEEHRGNNLGRRLMDKIIIESKERGDSVLRLNTGPYMEAAQHIYQDIGFTETDPYNSEIPDLISHKWTFMKYEF